MFLNLLLNPSLPFSPFPVSSISMAPQIITHRFKEDTTAIPNTPRTRQQTKKARAKRAIKSLAISIAVPICLTTTITILFGTSLKYNALTAPYWIPPLWLVHSASIASSFLMGFAAWLVWAESGFSVQSDALPLYISHLSLGLTWCPLVLKIGAVGVAFVFSVTHLITLFACYQSFKAVNPLAGDLVRPCLVWLTFLTVVNFKLMYIL